ncbi:MAG: hypothetical protein B7Z74_07395, partial [Deltaproteobacteria bacterium 21-66-5]
MPSKRLFWHLFPQVLTLLVASLASIGLISRFVNSVAARWLLAGPLVAGLALAVSWLIGRSVARSMQRLKAAAERFSSGHLSERLWMPDSREMAEMADAFNAMAEKLEAS